MKIPNYDPDFLTTTDYKQGHPCMPTDVFRILICGPSNSGKTNILLHMLYELLEYDSLPFFQNPPPKQISSAFTGLCHKSRPEVGYQVIEAPGDEIIPLEELPVDNQITCSRRSDSGARAKKKASERAGKKRGETGEEVLFPSLPWFFFSFVLFRSFSFSLALHYLNAWNRLTTKRLLSLTTWFVKATKTPSSPISSTGGTKTAALFISLKPFTRYQKTSATTVAIFALLHFFRKKTNESRTSLGWITNCWTAQPTKNIPSFTMTNPRN